MNPDDKEFDSKLEERFAQLPKVVQDAITSADVEKHLRELAERHKLHLDQWEKLENEVMLALLGFQPADELAKSIQSEVGVDEATAIELAADISTIVFVPIRQELERELEHPDAVAKVTTGVEDMRSQMLSDVAHEPSPVAPVPSVAQNAVPPVASTDAPAVTPPAADATTPSDAPAAPVAAPAPAVIPATPPAPAPTEKAERASIPDAYTSSASHERKTVAGDPYREQLE